MYKIKTNDTEAKNQRLSGEKNATTLAKVVILIMPKIIVKLSERLDLKSLLNSNPCV